MALTPPSTDDLAAFLRTEFSGQEEEWAELDIQRATDLMHIATGLEFDPADPVARRVMNHGILDMAVRLYVVAGNREELYTPFTSERIGSYSYQKAMNSATRGESTGVELFDAAVSYLIGIVEDGEHGVVRYNTEFVFERSEQGPYLKTTVEAADPVIDIFGR